MLCACSSVQNTAGLTKITVELMNRLCEVEIVVPCPLCSSGQKSAAQRTVLAPTRKIKGFLGMNPKPVCNDSAVHLREHMAQFASGPATLSSSSWFCVSSQSWQPLTPGQPYHPPSGVQRRTGHRSLAAGLCKDCSWVRSSLAGPSQLPAADTAVRQDSRQQKAQAALNFCVQTTASRVTAESAAGTLKTCEGKTSC